jgi:predicted exporter
MSAVAQRWTIAGWLGLVLACAFVVSRITITTDVSALLPRFPTPLQRVLVEQLREGVVTRLILIGIEGAPPDTLADLSKRLAADLRNEEALAFVENGDETGTAKDREFLWKNRYLVSSAVTPQRFTAAGLRERLEEDLRMLGSPAGMLLQRTLPNDPTGELLQILERQEGQARPAKRDGVWFSRDAKRALLVAQTRAPGYDIDAQERTVGMVRAAFAREAGASGAKLLLAGPAVYAVSMRSAIKGDALRLSLIATALVAALLLTIYRSVRVLGLGLLPVASGAITGVAAVALGFGAVHGVTLGFGVTLIGEGVDYAIFLFAQTAPGVAPQRALDRIWPTLRLGVLTSICGFSAMLFSGFSGLAQLGLFSVVGILVAAGVTRWVLPTLLPAGFAAPTVAAFVPATMAAVRRAPSLRMPLLVAVAAAGGALFAQRAPLWSDELSSLSPVPRADQLLDQQLRGDLGAPDVGRLVVISAPDEEAVLQAAEAVGEGLRRAAQAELLEGYESPADYLPSRRTQRARLASLGEAPALRANLQSALKGLPFRRQVFEPFLEDAAAARNSPFIDRGSLQGTRLGLRVDTLLVRRDKGWAAMLPLRGSGDAQRLAPYIVPPAGTEAVVLDLKRESDELFRAYRREALMHSLLGAAAIGVLLLASLRSLRRVFDVLAPLAAAVLITACVLVLSGQLLSMFHLVGLLLVVAIGSNYALFFDRHASLGEGHGRTVVSLLLANVTTLIGFGLLAFSKAPVLHAIGLTVAVGTALALVCSAILSRRDQGPHSPADR